MPNGAAVAHALHLVPEPITSPADDKAEIEIGQAVASAATAICQGAAEYMDGGLTPATREAGGERISKLFFLQEAFAGDFPAAAREQGAKVLWTYVRGQHSPDAAEAMIDLALTTVLDVLAKVTAAERALH